MNREELKEMRLGICAQYKIQYFKLYTRPEAAALAGKNVSTFQRWEEQGKIFPVEEMGKGVRYFGWQIADIRMGRAQPWDVSLKENSSLEIGGSEESPAPQPGTAAVSTKGPDRQSVSALAQRTFRKPRTPSPSGG